MNNKLIMNKEKYNQIIDEAYEKWIYESWNGRIYPNTNEKESFINKCKTNPEFSEKWGLKIEERELSLEERRKLANYDSQFISPITVESWDSQNIPTKLITITYNNEKTEIYE